MPSANPETPHIINIERLVLDSNEANQPANSVELAAAKDYLRRGFHRYLTQYFLPQWKADPLAADSAWKHKQPITIRATDNENKRIELTIQPSHSLKFLFTHYQQHLLDVIADKNKSPAERKRAEMFFLAEYESVGINFLIMPKEIKNSEKIDKFKGVLGAGANGKVAKSKGSGILKPNEIKLNSDIIAIKYSVYEIQSHHIQYEIEKNLSGAQQSLNKSSPQDVDKAYFNIINREKKYIAYEQNVNRLMSRSDKFLELAVPLSRYNYNTRALKNYILMDFIEGENIQTLITPKSSFEPPKEININQSLAIIESTLDSTLELSSKGHLHYDFKPGNIRLSEMEARLVDFSPPGFWTMDFLPPKYRLTSTPENGDAWIALDEESLCAIEKLDPIERQKAYLEIMLYAFGVSLAILLVPRLDLEAIKRNKKSDFLSSEKIDDGRGKRTVFGYNFAPLSLQKHKRRFCYGINLAQQAFLAKLIDDLVQPVPKIASFDEIKNRLNKAKAENLFENYNREEDYKAAYEILMGIQSNEVVEAKKEGVESADSIPQAEDLDGNIEPTEQEELTSQSLQSYQSSDVEFPKANNTDGSDNESLSNSVTSIKQNSGAENKQQNLYSFGAKFFEIEKDEDDSSTDEEYFNVKEDDVENEEPFSNYNKGSSNGDETDDELPESEEENKQDSGCEREQDDIELNKDDIQSLGAENKGGFNSFVTETSISNHSISSSTDDELNDKLRSGEPDSADESEQDIAYLSSGQISVSLESDNKDASEAKQPVIPQPQSISESDQSSIHQSRVSVVPSSASIKQKDSVSLLKEQLKQCVNSYKKTLVFGISAKRRVECDTLLALASSDKITDRDQLRLKVALVAANMRLGGLGYGSSDLYNKLNKFLSASAKPNAQNMLPQSEQHAKKASLLNNNAPKILKKESIRNRYRVLGNSINKMLFQAGNINTLATDLLRDCLGYLAEREKKLLQNIDDKDRLTSISQIMAAIEKYNAAVKEHANDAGKLKKDEINFKIKVLSIITTMDLSLTNGSLLRKRFLNTINIYDICQTDSLENPVSTDSLENPVSSQTIVTSMLDCFNKNGDADLKKLKWIGNLLSGNKVLDNNVGSGLVSKLKGYLTKEMQSQKNAKNYALRTLRELCNYIAKDFKGSENRAKDIKDVLLAIQTFQEDSKNPKPGQDCAKQFKDRIFKITNDMKSGPTGSTLASGLYGACELNKLEPTVCDALPKRPPVSEKQHGVNPYNFLPKRNAVRSHATNEYMYMRCK